LKQPVKFGVYIPGDLVEEVEAIMKEAGFRNKSRLIQEALKNFIYEYKWRYEGFVYGIIGVIYNHETEHIDDRLTDIQHEFLDVIVSTIHIHLDKERCMLAIIVKGGSDRVKKLFESINGLRGVLFTKTMLLGVEK